VIRWSAGSILINRIIAGVALIILVPSFIIVSLYHQLRLKSTEVLGDPIRIPPRIRNSLLGHGIRVEVGGKLRPPTLVPCRHAPGRFILVPVAERLDGVLAGVVLTLGRDTDAAEEAVGGVGHVCHLVHSLFIPQPNLKVNLMISMG